MPLCQFFFPFSSHQTVPTRSDFCKLSPNPNSTLFAHPSSHIHPYHKHHNHHHRNHPQSSSLLGRGGKSSFQGTLDHLTMDNPITSTPALGDVPSTQPAQTNHGPPTMSSAVPSLTSSNDSSSNPPPTKESPPSHADTNKNNPNAGHPTPPVEPVDKVPPSNSGSNIADNPTAALESTDSGPSHIPTPNRNSRAGNPTPPFSPLQSLSLSTPGGDPVASNTIPISSPDSIKRRRSGSFDDQEVQPEPCQSAVVPTSHNDMSSPSEDIGRKRRRLQRSITFVLPMKPDITNDDSDSDDDDMSDDDDDDDDDEDDDEDGGASIEDSDDSSGWGSNMSWEDHIDNDDDDDESWGAPVDSQQSIQLPSIQDHLKTPSAQSVKLAPLWAYGNARSSSEKMLPRIKKRPSLDLSRLKQFHPLTQEAAARNQGAAAPVWDFSIETGLDEEAYVRPCHRIDYYKTRRHHAESDTPCTNSAEDLDSSKRYAHVLPQWADLRNGAAQAVLLYERAKATMPWLHPTCVADLGCKLGNGTLAILDALPEECAVQGWDSNEDFIELANDCGDLALDDDDERSLDFGVMSIQEFNPRYEDLVLCMDTLQVMSRLGRLYTMSRILKQMQENAVLAVWIPNSCSLPYALFRETVEERGPWNKWFETEKVRYLMGAQAFLPLEPLVQWEATVAPFCKAFLVKEVVDPFPIPRGFESVYEWMVLEMAPMVVQLDNDQGAKSAFLRRYKEKLVAAYQPKFGQIMTMDITVRYLFAVRSARGSSTNSEYSEVESLSSREDSGPATPPKEDEIGPQYLLKRASRDSLDTATGYILLCFHNVCFSCADEL